MGARNVALVFAYWPNLPNAPKLVLVRMAHSALDAPEKGQPEGRVPPDLYFGGQVELARALGPGRNPDGTPRDPASPAALKAVRRHLAYLRRVGAISIEKQSAPGRRTAYRGHWAGPVDNPSRRTLEADPNGGRQTGDNGGR